MGVRVDVHPENGLPMVEQAGEFRVLAALPPPARRTFAAYGDVLPTLPRSEWKPVQYRDFADWPRRNQRQSSCCTGYSSTTALRYQRKVNGMAPELLSPFFVYGLINNGVDNGASVYDTLVVLEKRGACRESLLPELARGTYAVSQYTQQQYEDAMRFRVFRALTLRSFDDIGSALTRGHLCVVGVAIGANFQHMQKGVCPVPDRIIGGHALPLVGLDNIGQYGWCPQFENSWSDTWGDKGFGFLQEAYWNPAYGFPFDAYALLSAEDDPRADNGPGLI